MTPERWRRIDELFAGALRIDPAEREAWLRGACGDDEGLRAEVARLLDQDERAARDGFLTPPESASQAPRRDGELVSPRRPPSPGGTGPAEHAGAMAVDEAGRFAPKAAIACGARSHPSVGARSLAQQRLRELTIIYLLIAGMMLFWKYVVLRDPDPTQAIPYAIVLAALGGIVSLPLEPEALSLLRAQGPGAGDDRDGRGRLRLRPVPGHARLLAARRPDEGAARDEESGAHHRGPDPLLRDLRPEELAPRGPGRRAARDLAVRDLAGALSPTSPRRWGGWGEWGWSMARPRSRSSASMR